MLGIMTPVDLFDDRDGSTVYNSEPFKEISVIVFCFINVIIPTQQF